MRQRNDRFKHGGEGPATASWRPVANSGQAKAANGAKNGADAVSQRFYSSVVHVCLFLFDVHNL